MGTRVLLGVALLCVALGAMAAERRVYPCHRLGQAPVIDGTADDEAWRNLPEATGFHVFNGAGKYATEKQTCFKAGWTDEALYLLVQAEEPTPGKLSAKAKDGGALWEDDSIELFFLPSGAPAYTQLLVNSVGGRYNGRGNDVGAAKMLDWEAKASVGKTGWLFEARVPFKTILGSAPKEGDAWPVNVARDNVVGPAGERNTCWPELTKGFNETANFGSFVFKGPVGSEGLAEERELNRAYVLAARLGMQAEIKAWAGLAWKYNQGLADARKIASLRGEAEDLLRTWARAQDLAARPEPAWQELRRTRQDCFNLGHRSDDCVARAKMEELFQE